MKNWALHHLHFMIVMDALIHVIILALCVSAIVLGFKFVKAIKQHPHATRGIVYVAYFMPIAAAIMTWFSVSSLFFCVRHYGAWWSK